MMDKIATPIALLALASSVSAHGALFSFAAAGKEYSSFAYYDQDKLLAKSPVHVTDYLTPVYDIYSEDFVCGINARAAKGIASVSPGDTISWGWRTDDSKPWVHFEGTERVFLASCNGDCSTAKPSELQWFELDEMRRGKDNSQSGASDGWPVKTLNDGGRWDDVLPKNIPNGDFLMRNELTAYHYSNKPVETAAQDGHQWGMEYYATCASLRISGGSGSIPNKVMTINNGAWQVNQAGHYNPDLWSGKWQFTWAEPSLWNRVSTGNNNSDDSGSDDNSGSDDSSDNSGSSGECRQKKRSTKSKRNHKRHQALNRL